MPRSCRRCRMCIPFCVVVVFSLTVSFITAADDGEPAPEAKPLPAAEKKDDAPAAPPWKIPVVMKSAGLPGWITSLAFSADGKQLYAGTEDRLVVLDVTTKQTLATRKLKVGFLRALAVHPTEPLLAIAGYQTLQVWHTGDWRLLKEIKGHRAYVTGVVWSPDGTRLATACEDELGRIFSFNQTAPPILLKGHEFPVNGVAWSANGEWIATAAGDETRVTKPGEVKVWSATDGQLLADFPFHKKAATGVAFSPDSRFLTSTSYDERVNVYVLETRKPHGFFGGHGRPTTGVVFHPNGETIISGSGGRFVGGHEIKLWQRTDGDERAALKDHEGRISALAISRDGKRLASGSYDQTVIVYDLKAVKPAVTASPSINEQPANAEHPENRPAP